MAILFSKEGKVAFPSETLAVRFVYRSLTVEPLGNMPETSIGLLLSGLSLMRTKLLSSFRMQVCISMVC